MGTQILMPALSPTMTEGTLARWLKKEGDTIKAGDVIAEIETDKATMEVEAVDEGVLAKILVPEGTAGVAVNAPIAELAGEGGAKPAPAPKPEAKAEAQKAAPAPAAKAAFDPQPDPPKAGNGHDRGERVFASPLARRMAAQAGIDLATLKGSGPNGRIVKADVEAAMAVAAPRGEAAPAAAAPAPAPALAPKAPAPSIAVPHTLVPHSTMRKVIARRLSESKATIPHFYATVDVELDALLKLRAELNAKSPKDGPGAWKVSVNDMIIKASAIALRRLPKVNASWQDDGMVMYQDVDISVAVAIPDGLITPIIRKADLKGLATISNEMKDLAARARAGKLKPEEFQGGSFSISNMGMMGVKDFAAIINPPQAAILAVSAGEQRPVVKDGALAIATVMTVTLSVDHRVIDGALAAEWLGVFKGIVEDPLQMML
ncbi:pyruvate dehydrogenase complex dihydrolipoamide acetyltransferase [Elioraea sp. Yellowstone]|jgi:pyruvate dehydrogenase E2 component (dihydrolipoamide acetyltransferase)|uniref:pyruvate dehydrogenase complex dihydrolipoamide acetyltransferase n=1 Tax=Elioraea sp. Yellowstone TaxID=2592070 RepID=UPI00114D509D|nr:pyruvate dehydrogenase complex dihydrolipoamide acetyltransferase [Elioraea sp. Yellowstone]TQF84834.1 pyruvate dehydrogenase complex dihydrolipoamide acetyltransferase [Elioraea sp. Yellowstone]